MFSIFKQSTTVKIIASKMLNWLIIENNIIPFHNMNVNVDIITFSFMFIAHMASKFYAVCLEK